ncbi:MAG: glycosyltransferase family 2 protein [Kiritimatiellae bacterium]|nr:glycosyltransferase family 2 protein [Kiritimatiellia bacterium]
MKTIELSVVVPVFREEEIIGEFHRRLNAVLETTGLAFEILYVDDQSDGPTVTLLKKIADGDGRVKVVSLSRNFGHQVALTAGIDLARGAAVVMLDGDLQHPPELIPTLIGKWREGYDIVYTIRQETKGISPMRRSASRLFYALMTRITEVDMDIHCADFRLMSRRAVEGFKQVRESARFIRGIVGWMGYRKIGIPFTSTERERGRSKYSPRKLFKFALDGILSFSVVPIRMISLVGLAVSGISFLYFLRILYYVFFSQQRSPANLPTLTLILFVSGIQLVMMGVLGEYLGQVFTETKNRPLYLVDEIYFSGEADGDSSPSGPAS